MNDQLVHLLKEKDRTAARVVGAAQMALWFFEAQDFAATERVLRAALDEHNQATRNYIEYLASSPARKENHGNRPAA